MRFMNLSLVLSLTGLIACGDKSDDTSTGSFDANNNVEDTGEDTGEDNTNPDADADADEGPPPGGFGINGVAVDPFTGTPGAAGLCVAAADPTPALVGGDLGILATGTTGEGGTYALADVRTESTLGIVVVISDCEGADSTQYSTATGISAASYGELGEGDVLEGQTSFILTNDMTATFDGNLAAAGYESSFSAEGGLVNFIFDAAGEPVADASVACTAGTCPAFYNTGIGEGGFSFVDAEGATATATGVDGLAILPGAPITTYEVTHETMVFDSATMGSLPGIALFVSMNEDTAK